MGQVTFTPDFSGGEGNLDITFPFTGDVIHFSDTNYSPVTLTMPQGIQHGQVEGTGSKGSGGNITLSITGDIPYEMDISYPKGIIPINPLTILVTI